jgi:hypothetical protein
VNVAKVPRIPPARARTGLPLVGAVQRSLVNDCLALGDYAVLAGQVIEKLVRGLQKAQLHTGLRRGAYRVRADDEPIRDPHQVVVAELTVPPASRRALAEDQSFAHKAVPNPTLHGPAGKGEGPLFENPSLPAIYNLNEANHRENPFFTSSWNWILIATPIPPFP